MTLRPCDRTWQLDALREGRLAVKDAESFERHSRSCSTCTATLTRDERLRALGAALPAVEPPPLALRRVRGRLLRDLSMLPEGGRRPWLQRPRVAVIAPAFGVALLAVLYVFSHGVSDRRVETTVAAPLAASYAGSVSAGPGSAWKQTRDAQIEKVELGEGTLRVHVRPQRPGERFLVVLPDGELEVRGTTFDVEVASGRTARVHVDEGVVELRLHDASVRTLAAGTAWAAETLEPAPTPSPAASVTPPKVRVERANDADDGAAYAEAIRLFRDGHYGSAAGAFHAFAHSSPRATEAEDASFLEAVALARSGRLDAAALAAERHLESYPRSFRARDASLLIARAASRRGDCGRARGVLAPWSSSPSAPRDGEVDAVLRACEGGAPLDTAR